MTSCDKVTDVPFAMDPTPSKVTGGFVAGDTKIALMDGHTCSIADVVEQLHRGVHRTTYSLQADGNVHAVQIRLARREEGDAPVLRVQFDDGAVLHCSPHQLLLAPTGERALYEFQVDHLHNVAHPSGIFLHD